MEMKSCFVRIERLSMSNMKAFHRTVPQQNYRSVKVQRKSAKKYTYNSHILTKRCNLPNIEAKAEQNEIKRESKQKQNISQLLTTKDIVFPSRYVNKINRPKNEQTRCSRSESLKMGSYKESTFKLKSCTVRLEKLSQICFPGTYPVSQSDKNTLDKIIPEGQSKLRKMSPEEFSQTIIPAPTDGQLSISKSSTHDTRSTCNDNTNADCSDSVITQETKNMKNPSFKNHDLGTEEKKTDQSPTIENDKAKKKGLHDKSPGRKPYRPCLLCGKMQSKLALHLKRKHSDDVKIKHALSLPKVLRDRAISVIRKEGIFEANKAIISDTKNSDKNDQYIRERSQGKSHLAMCSLCKGFYSKGLISRHKRKCSVAEATSSNPVAIPISLLNVEECEQFRNDVLSKFRKDEIGELCRSDPLLRLYGNQNYRKVRTRPEKKTELRQNIMADMRRLGCLFLAFKSIVEKSGLQVSSCEDMFERTKFPFLQEAVDSTTLKDDKSVKYGLKMYTGFLLKKVLKMLKGKYLSLKEDAKASEVDNFVCLLTFYWPTMFADAEYSCVKSRQLNLRKPQCLPEEEDISKLRNKTLTNIAEMVSEDCSCHESENFKELRDSLVCRLTLFNARRGGEPCRLLLHEWKDAENDVWVSPKATMTITDPLEKSLLGKYKVAYHAGKVMGQMVPLLIPKDCVKGMQIMADKQIRDAAGVHVDNPFLFPHTRHSDEHVKGWNAVDRICKEAGLSKHLTATSIRHRASTIYAGLDMPEKDRQAFYTHMGHSEHTNKEIYQCPMAVTEVTRIGRFFNNLDERLGAISGTSRSTESMTVWSSRGEHLARKTMHVDPGTADEEGKCNNSTLNTSQELSPTCLVRYEETSNDNNIDNSSNDEDYKCDDEDSMEDDDNSEENDGSSDDEITFKSEQERKSKGHRIRWLEKDTNILKEYFKSYVDDTSTSDRTGSLPGKVKVQAFIKKYPSVLGSLHAKRKLYLIRTKIYNERNKTRRIVFTQLNHMRR